MIEDTFHAEEIRKQKDEYNGWVIDVEEVAEGKWLPVISSTHGDGEIWVDQTLVKDEQTAKRHASAMLMAYKQGVEDTRKKTLDALKMLS
jgi:hypothetical protein